MIAASRSIATLHEHWTNMRQLPRRSRDERVNYGLDEMVANLVARDPRDLGVIYRGALPRSPT
jgi:hypothetical protein